MFTNLLSIVRFSKWSHEQYFSKHRFLDISGFVFTGAQRVKFEKGTIEFKNYFKQIPVAFKIYADFECYLESVDSSEGSYSK